MEEEQESKGPDRRWVLAGGASALVAGGTGWWLYGLLSGLEEIRQRSQISLPPPVAMRQRPLVFATSYPAFWILQRLTVDRFMLQCVLPAGEDPRRWRPSVELKQRLEAAALIVANGAGYEPWIADLTMPADRMHRLVPEAVGLIGAGTVAADAAAAGSSHTWADPVLFQRQATTLLPILESFDPEGTAEFRSNMRLLELELTELAAEFRALLSVQRRVRFAASSSVYGYLARRFGLDVLPFDFSPTEVRRGRPDPAFTGWLQGQFAPTILWHAPPTEAVKASFPEIVRHFYLDPLDAPAEINGRVRFDYMIQARRNVEVLRRLFSEL